MAKTTNTTIKMTKEERTAKRAEAREIRQGEKDLMKQLRAEQKEAQFNQNLTNYTISQHVKDELNKSLNTCKIGLIKLAQRMQDRLKDACVKEIQDLKFTIQRLDEKALVNAKEIGIAEDKVSQLTQKWVDYTEQIKTEAEEVQLKSEYVVRDEDYGNTLAAFLTT